MKANALRIGNYVDSENGIGKITCIEEKRVCVDCDKLTYTPIDIVRAIPLTKEWLIKLGFKKDSDLNSLFSLNGINCNTSNMEFTLGSGKIKEIKYVHQLQNIYFALTGEELTVKLKNMFDIKTLKKAIEDEDKETILSLINPNMEVDESFKLLPQDVQDKWNELEEKAIKIITT